MVGGVGPDKTATSTYRQKSRSLADPALMVRDVDETSPKPETNTVSEPFAAEMKQIASVSTGTPNVLLASGSFAQWVNVDLTSAWRAAVDGHIIDEITDATIGDDEGFVFDSSALGTLFLGPFALAVFEEAAGSTNSSTVRAESNGRFVVQRPAAAATLSDAS